MKTVTAIACLGMVALVLARPDDKYTTKYDNVNIDDILKSDRLLTNYFNCLMDKGNCTPDAAELKAILPDALENGCSKCSDKHKEATRKVIHYLLKNKRSMWDELEAKYDPERKYVKKYDAEIKAEGIVL